MEVTIESVDQVQIIEVGGNVDSRTAPLLRERISAAVDQDSQVLLDLSRVEMMSSAGLRVLLLLYRQLSGGRGQMVLVGLPPLVRDVMHNTGFLHFFTTATSREEGLVALAKGQRDGERAD